ncbi:MAG: cyclopropane fatty acyl phospholipid synthase [Candidatus Magasanikbacteria bacterium]|nr:cyclopropane fatty acyl phospholipid synthase [Candidatus Magasanikbacteria bacterium]
MFVQKNTRKDIVRKWRQKSQKQQNKAAAGVAVGNKDSYALNAGRKSKAFEIGKKHYDIGNDLFRAMLDKRLTYTCGYWKNAGNLADAQEAKLDLVCKKIGLKSGQKILDIGSGCGSFMGYAAEKYGVSALGVTVSNEQKELTDKVYKNFPIETKLQDYRSINGKFDHIVSLGMFEHVGAKNYKGYMKVVHRCLNNGGIFLLHTIWCNKSDQVGDPWFDKYIFPGGKLPSIKQIAEVIEGLFVMEDWQNFGADYDKTLMAWYNNFNENWDKIKSNYNERFRRMWRYYLLACAGSFRARKNQLWQVVLSKKGVRGGYQSIR